ncbi:MAG: hypothetical protein RLZZ196_3550, partial [Bacteroidota bacterium]
LKGTPAIQLLVKNSSPQGNVGAVPALDPIPEITLSKSFLDNLALNNLAWFTGIQTLSS